MTVLLLVQVVEGGDDSITEGVVGEREIARAVVLSDVDRERPVLAGVAEIELIAGGDAVAREAR